MRLGLTRNIKSNDSGLRRELIEMLPLVEALRCGRFTCSNSK